MQDRVHAQGPIHARSRIEVVSGWLTELENTSTDNGIGVVNGIYERMDGHGCHIKSETCHRAEKAKKCWVCMKAMSDIRASRY
jgi:hypothetical protein